MKKLLSLLAACALCGSMLAALPVSAEETTRKTGDIDGDGFVDSDDAVYIIRYYEAWMKGEEESFVATCKKNDPNIDLSLEIADINKDGAIDQYDCILIAKFFTLTIIESALDTIEEYYGRYTSDGKRKLGDITGDGKVDLNDSAVLQKYYTLSLIMSEQEDVLTSIYNTYGRKAQKFWYYYNVADINKDKKVDLDDVLLIQKYYTLSILGEAPDTIEEWLASYKK